MKTSPRAFLGFPVDIMDPARILGVNAIVNLAGWETCAIALSVKFRADMVHAQTTQRNANVTTIFMAQNVKGNYSAFYVYGPNRFLLAYHGALQKSHNILNLSFGESFTEQQFENIREFFEVANGVIITYTV